MKSPKILLLTMLFSLTNLFSCMNENSFINYIGTMRESSLQNHFSTQEKQINDEALPALEQDYYIDLYFLNNIEELLEFYSTIGISCDQREQDFVLTQSKENAVLYGLASIPQGYRAYKPNDIQILMDNVISLVTPSFYYYASNPDLYYLNIELQPDNTIKETYKYSFFYLINSSFDKNLNLENIRVLYRLT